MFSRLLLFLPEPFCLQWSHSFQENQDAVSGFGRVSVELLASGGERPLESLWGVSARVVLTGSGGSSVRGPVSCWGLVPPRSRPASESLLTRPLSPTRCSPTRCLRLGALVMGAPANPPLRLPRKDLACFLSRAAVRFSGTDGSVVPQLPLSRRGLRCSASFPTGPSCCRPRRLSPWSRPGSCQQQTLSFPVSLHPCRR